MKKHDILKVTGISFLVLVLLTWIIPAGTYSGAEFVKGEVIPTGLLDVFYNPLMMIGVVLQYAVILLVIGGFYGVLSKTGVYTKIVNGVVKKFTNKEKRFLIISIITFALLASVVGNPFVLFILVPFAAAVITLLGFNKVTTMLSTIGALMIGVIGSTTGSDMAGALVQSYTTEITNNLLVKAIILVVITVLYTMTVLKMSKVAKVVKKVEVKEETKKTTKKATTKAETKGKKDVVKVKKETKKETKVETKKEVKKALLYNSKELNKNKSVLPLLIICSILMIIIVLSTFNWSLFSIKFFDELHASMIELKVFDRAILDSILGYFVPFGHWDVYHLVALLLVSIPLVGWVYSIKFDDMIDGFVEGVKVMVKPAFAVLLASLMFSVFITVSDYGLSLAQNNIYFTIMDFLLGLTKEFNSLVIAVITFIGGFMISDFSILNSFISMPLVSMYEAESFNVVTLVVQCVYGLTLFIAPSSMLLLAGLSLFDINYKEWLKTVGKLIIKIALLILIVLVITMFI